MCTVMLLAMRMIAPLVASKNVIYSMCFAQLPYHIVYVQECIYMQLLYVQIV